MNKEFYLSNLSFYAPSIESKEDMLLFAQDKIEIPREKATPLLKYTDPLFRRRLSQLSKMTIEVLYNLYTRYNVSKDTKIVFGSFRGEITREFALNKSLYQDQMIMPAAFSLSVFNAPVALATIACGVKAGYNTIYNNNQDFRELLTCAASSVIAGKDEKVIFVYADELIPEEYAAFAPSGCYPMAFACVVSGMPNTLTTINSTNSPLDKTYNATSIDANSATSNKTDNETLDATFDEPSTGHASLTWVKYSIDKISKNVYDFTKQHILKCEGSL